MEFLRTQTLAINGKVEVIAQKEAAFKELLFRTVQSRSAFAMNAKALKLFIDSECGKARESIPADIKAIKDDALFRSLRWGFFRKQDLRPLLMREVLHMAYVIGVNQDAIRHNPGLWRLVGLGERETDMLFAAAENRAAAMDERVRDTFSEMDAFTSGRNKYVSLPTLNIGICATMSAGKSTFVNALLGRDILPSRNEATTARITSVYDDDAQKGAAGFVVYGRELMQMASNIDKKQVDEWNSSHEVSRIWVQADLDNIASDRFITAVHDTPGTNNSGNETHHEVTMKFLKSNRMDMIIFVANATQVGVNDESALLKELLDTVVRKNGTPVLFVMNKADCIDDEKESLTDIMNEYAKYVMHIGYTQFAVLPASSKAARLFKMAVKGKENDFSAKERTDFKLLVEQFGCEDMKAALKKTGIEEIEKYITQCLDR